MNPALRRDLKVLEALAFHRVDACGGVIAEFHQLSSREKKHVYYPLLECVYSWLLSPFSLWPIDFVGVAKHLISCIKHGRKADPQFEILLSFLKTTPSQRARAEVGDHEQQVRTGNYETLIKAQKKFTYKEEILAANPRFKADWNSIKNLFDVGKYRDPKGIIRRRRIQERSFRSHDWGFDWHGRKKRFENVFDAFCHRWVLYGMEGDRPLLQKLSINVNPYGTMIFIPRYWSMDWKRDLKRASITKLHRSRGVQRQGEKLGAGEVERIKQAFKVQELWEDGRRQGLRGEKRKEWVVERMRWHPDSDFSKARRLLKLARQFTTGG